VWSVLKAKRQMLKVSAHFVLVGTESERDLAQANNTLIVIVICMILLLLSPAVLNVYFILYEYILWAANFND